MKEKRERERRRRNKLGKRGGEEMKTMLEGAGKKGREADGGDEKEMR